MSAQDLNRVHRRYIAVSNTFKSSWTFHQFIQGLRKVFAEVPTSQYPADFQSVYGELKRVSENLSETSLGEATEQLDRVEEQLMPLVRGLLEIDEQVSPGLLRQFFQRVKNFDDNILTQLVKFYLHTRSRNGWHLDRLDKADFLSTKVAEEYNDSRGAFVLCDRTQLRELAQGFWAALAVAPVADAEVDGVCLEITTLAGEILSIDSIDELHQHSLIQRYRELKHSLGDAFFQPRVWTTVLETNLVMKNHIQQLYRRDEQRIIAEYQQVFELERDVPVDVELGAELSEFREAVERFESQLQGENVRLGELAELREKVRDLMPKLQPSGESTGPFVPPSEVREQTTLVVEQSEDDHVEENYQAIVSALDDTNPTLDPKKIALQPEIFALGIGPREVVAYRRIYSGGDCDRAAEQFVLQAAALRSLIEQEVEEIKGILDDTAATRDAPIFGQASQTAQLGDLFLRRFEHRIEQAVLVGDGADAQALQVLKMRLMRGFSGLWLLLHRI
ncbi:MAG: hypothetical protein GY719_17335 [bacterium]|nr:hypothetical protein [bacterium]